MGYVIYAGIASPDRFEGQITEFLMNRTTQINSDDAITEQSIYGKSLNWLALLFAILASGAQCSGMPRKERELTSQVYSKSDRVIAAFHKLTSLKSVAALNACASQTSCHNPHSRAYKHWS